MIDQANRISLQEIVAGYIVDTDQPRFDDIWNGQILLISNDHSLQLSFTNVIHTIGGRCSEPLPLNFEPEELTKNLNLSAVILHLNIWNQQIQSTLGRIEHHCELLNIPLLIRTDLELLDEIIGEVTYANVEYLLSDSAAELLVSLNHRTKKSQNLLFTNRDELDISDLKKISADVNRIATALVKLSGPEHTSNDRNAIPSPFIEPMEETKVSDAPVSFKAEDTQNLKPLGLENTQEQSFVKETISAEQVRSLIKARRLRDQYFDSELFADPAWDMLLDLMAAHLEGTRVSVSSLCIAASVPPTTALRWIKTMTEEKIFFRKADEQDGRRIFIELSDDAVAGMVGFFQIVRRNGLMLV